MQKKFEHIDTAEFTGFASVEVKEVRGFVSLAEANGVKHIFRSGAPDRESPPAEFYFPVALVVYRIKAADFIAIEDYHTSVEKKYPCAADYYEAVKKGFDSYEEFRHSKEAGTNGSKEHFDLAKTAGFVRGFDTFLRKYEKYKTFKHTASIAADLDNPVKLYEYATAKGFKAWGEFEKAYDAGYPEASIYTEATSKGFNTADDFFDAVAKGFALPTEYEEAKKLLISSKKEWDDYRYLKAGNFKNKGFDEHHLLMLLRDYKNGSKLSLDALRKLLVTDQEKYYRTFTGSDVKVLPVWYTQKISTNDNLHNFLHTNADIKRIGTYNENQKVFEIFRINRTNVYVDASNVAHNSAGNAKSIPQFKNLRRMVDELHDVWKFNNIMIIADASLRHKAKDTHELERLKKIAEYHESPSHTSADNFLLELIHRDKSIIISNDTFSDWQQKDLWVKKNIDNLRVPFMIKETHVVLVGIEKHVNPKDE
jgi:hypothetical protein